MAHYKSLPIFLLFFTFLSFLSPASADMGNDALGAAPAVGPMRRVPQANVPRNRPYARRDNRQVRAPVHPNLGPNEAARINNHE